MKTMHTVFIKEIKAMAEDELIYNQTPIFKCWEMITETSNKIKGGQPSLDGNSVPRERSRS